VDYAGFVKAADAGRVPPVTLLHGPEPFLLDDAVARLSRALFPGQTELSLVREILDARTAGAEGIVQSALMLPWLGDRRLVVARGIEGLAAAPSAVGAACTPVVPHCVPRSTGIGVVRSTGVARIASSSASPPPTLFR